MLKIDDQWVWDFWVADDGDRFHVFYLHAAKSLREPARRHRAARIGHAISTNLRDWDVLGDVFEVGAPGSFDETATWTGCVVRGEDDLWRMFYTGARFLENWPDRRNIETIGVATSQDLHHWRKQPGPVVEADARWYETFGTSSWREEVWRDPWVYHDREDGRWHMLVTARSNSGPVDERGVIGHAVSDDLISWTVKAPLTKPGLGFAHFEVPQLLESNEVQAGAILFSCSHDALSQARRDAGDEGGVWLLPLSGASHGGPAQPERITDETLYSARIVVDRDGIPFLIAVLHLDSEGEFDGGLTDPLPVALDARGLPERQQRVESCNPTTL
jgi:beta-fructofuranosidase